jgi:hypothetical protein
MMSRPISCGFISMLRDYFLDRSAAALLSLAMLFAVTGTSHAEWFADAGIRGVYDDNVNLAANKQDRKGDTSLLSSVSLGYYDQLADSTGLTVSAEAKYSDFFRFGGLDNLESGLTASLKYKRGLGSYAPWIRVFGSASYADFRENIRDTDSVRTGLSLGKRMQERIFTQIGYEYDEGRARNSRFDTRSSVVSARLDYLLTQSAQAWIGYAWSSGMYVIYVPVSRAPNVPGAVIVDTFKDPANAFRVHATAQALSLGASKALASHWSANIGADFINIYGRGRDYPDSLYKAGIVYAY